MRSSATSRFWGLFRALPADVRSLAVKTYQLWRRDPRHPSLRFRKLQGATDLFTVRVGEHYRALAMVRGETVTWIWIGSHAEYDRLTGKTS